MPRLNPLIVNGSRVSAVPKFLRDTGFLNHVTGVDINRQGCRFQVTVEDIYVEGGQSFGRIKFDAAPDQTFNLLLTCLKFEGQRPQRTTRVRQQQVTGVDDKGDPDLLDDAIQDPLPEDEDSEEVVLDENGKKAMPPSMKGLPTLEPLFVESICKST